MDWTGDDCVDLGFEAVMPTMVVSIPPKQRISFRSTEEILKSYGKETLLGNWSEERNCVVHLSDGEKLPSYISHNYQTTYSKSYNCSPTAPLPPGLRDFNSYPSKRRHVAFPSHQPELQGKVVAAEDWISCYKDHFRKKDITCKKCHFD